MSKPTEKMNVDQSENDVNQEKRVRVRSRKNKRKHEETEEPAESKEVENEQIINEEPTEESNQSEKQQNKNNHKRNNNLSAMSHTLFISNFPYNVTKQDIEKHFSGCGSVKSVRLLTDKQTKKPKGFGFIDFNDHESSCKALDLHLSDFNGRKIKVALTAGGGGNSETRRTKIVEKNKKVKSHIKAAKKTDESAEIEQVEEADNNPLAPQVHPSRAKFLKKSK